MIRPFDWRDIPVLHRYRDQGVFLSSLLVATRGTLLLPATLLAYLAPGSNVCTAIFRDDNQADQPLLGQVTVLNGEPCARITYLAPKDGLDDSQLVPLLEHLAVQAGYKGAYHLIAEVVETTPVYQALRHAGFSTYARQRVWQAEEKMPDNGKLPLWQVASDDDKSNIHVLFHNVVPGLIQKLEPLSFAYPRGMVLYEQGHLIGYVDLVYGHNGIWAQPFLHPDVDAVQDVLAGMLASIPESRGRAIYLCVRTYQSWLESALDALGAQAGEPQAVMVKRLAASYKVPSLAELNTVETQPDMTAPIARFESESDLTEPEQDEMSARVLIP